MSFPIEVKSNIQLSGISLSHKIVLNSGLTTLIGPNGSGKTQILRGLKNSFNSITNKKIQFISAGRIGTIEHFRSDYDGYRGTNIQYDSANFGTKGDVQRRHNIETLNGNFQTLSERPDILVKVQERLRKLFKRDLSIDWDAGSLKVSFTHFEFNSEAYSSGREASGLLHLIGILGALYDDEIGVLLIDEPEVSLHPQLQSFLLKEIKSVSGFPSKGGYKKLIVQATHSTEMVEFRSIDELPSLVFCYNPANQPIQISRDAGELQSQKLKSLMARIGQEHKLALFSKKPLLVEGPSDSIICAGIDNKLNYYLEASGSQLLPVIGKGQFPIVVKLMNLLGKTPFVLADADAVADNLELTNYFFNTDKANEIVAKLGFSSATKMSTSIFNDFCQLVMNDWDNIKTLAENSIYWKSKKDDDDLDIIKRRSAFSMLFSVEQSKIVELDKENKWGSIKERLKTMISVLRNLNCFVLTKGPIEAYYKTLSDITSLEKPSAAVTEVEYLLSLTEAEVKMQYDEIVKCVEDCAKSEIISEAEALRDLLLAVISPLVASLNNSSTEQKLNSLARSIIGDRSKLFKYEILKNENNVYGIRVLLNSQVLEIDGIPFVIQKNDNPIVLVNTSLGINV